MTSPRQTPWWRKMIKITLWTVMAVVLTVAASVLCVLRVLDSDSLTRISNAAANRMLDADVSIGRVELSLYGKAPFIRIDVDSLSVISKSIRPIDDSQRDSIPEWADTLLTLSHFDGSINLTSLLLGRIDLGDVRFTEPQINLFILNDSVNNYSIYTAAESNEPDTTAFSMPAITINRFAIERPRPIRFLNATTGDRFDLTLATTTLSGAEAPMYTINVSGKAETPILGTFNLSELRFGVNGRIEWNPDCPDEISLENFDVMAHIFQATADADIQFGDDIIIKDYALQTGSLNIGQLIGLIPEDNLKSSGIDPTMFHTDIAINAKVKSTAPFNLTTDTIPHADIELTVEPGSLRYGTARFTKIGGTATASIKGENLGDAIFSLKDFIVSGPATDLRFNITASQVMTDPLLKGTISGHTNLGRLPAPVKKMLDAMISGEVTADISFEGRPSMFARNTFHRLRIKGDIDADNIHYRSADTATNVQARHICFQFGTNETVDGADSLLTAIVRVDTADIRHQGMTMNLSELALGIGTSNRQRSDDTTHIIPMGGGISLKSFRFSAPEDSIRLRLRGISGRIGMQRYNGETRLPLFNLDISARMMSGISQDLRFMLAQSEIHATAYRKPRNIPERIKNKADSIRRAHPELPPDSVYAMAVRMSRTSGNRRRRANAEFTSSESEIIDFGASSDFKKMLRQWVFEGKLESKRAAVSTPVFPLKNRLRNFNLTFNNDSICLDSVHYQAGSSDFTISGRITDIRRSITSRGYRQPIQINFNVHSDTIDVNELADAIFRSAAYTTPDTPSAEDDILTDAEFDKEFGQVAQAASDSVSPLLIPVNVNMNLNMTADNLRYADMLFHDFSGELQTYRGALNLNHLTAVSDAGRIDLSALYSGVRADELRFGFGLQVKDFNINRFTRLFPAIDSIMPLMQDIRGIIDGDVTATCDIDSAMDLMLPTLHAAISLKGDSLELIDRETYRMIGKWLMFKDKQSNVIDHMAVNITIADNQMQLYPFIFDIDRYRLGVQGYNDLALNFDYHIAVLKSPLPFKFGINLKGNPDDYKIRVGRARLNEKQATGVALTDTTRVNLLREFENIFRRGVDRSKLSHLNVSADKAPASVNIAGDTISSADSLIFIDKGLIPAPPTPVSDTDADNTSDKRKEKKSKKSNKSDGADNRGKDNAALLNNPTTDTDTRSRRNPNNRNNA